VSALRWSGRATSLALATALVAALVGPATADDAVAPTDVYRIDAGTLVRETTNPQTADERDLVEEEFLEDSANNGRLYDASEVEAAVLGDVTVAWPDSVDISHVVAATDDASDAVGLAVVAGNHPTSGDQTLARMGSESMNDVDGQWGDRDGGVVQVTSQGYKILSGWERWRVRETKADREVFYYGHWVTAYGHYQSGWDTAPYIVEAASRPKEGRRGSFLQLRNYWPKVEQPSCSAGEISVSVMGFGGSLPLQNCSSLRPDADANAIKMDVVWNAGECKDQTVEGADLGMAVDVDPGKLAVLSDYSYAQFNPVARPCDGDHSDNIRVIYADPGW